jgi:hypothetical protein
MRFILISILFLLPVLSRAQQQPSPEAEQFFSMAMSQINSKHVGWIKRTAADTNYNNLNQQVLGRKAKAYAGIYSITGEADIQALVFLVLMQASKSANEDIRAIMEKVKSDNEKKKKLREAQETIKNNQAISPAQYDSFNLALIKPVIKQQVSANQNNASVHQNTISRQDISGLAERVSRDLSSMNEMSEMNNMRLQMAMDRLSKMQSALSNILKKIDSTKNQIVQNLK